FIIIERRNPESVWKPYLGPQLLSLISLFDLVQISSRTPLIQRSIGATMSLRCYSALISIVLLKLFVVYILEGTLDHRQNLSIALSYLQRVDPQVTHDDLYW